MTTYKEISGKQIKNYSSDPANDAEGQVWYNSTDGAFKSVLATGAWSSGSPTINLTNSGGGAGTQTAGLIFAGRNPSVPAFVSTTEEYNGSGWASGGAINTARSYIAGFGLQTAAVGGGGRIDAPGTNTNATEEYNGSAWTTVNPMGSARRMQNAGVGILTAGLGVGPSATEEYDGTNWTAGGALNTTRENLAGFGTQTAAAAAGGNPPPGTYSNAVEEYNGTSWTTVTVLPAIRQSAGAAGTQTQGIIFGGELPGATATAFTYDGTNWTAAPSMGTAGFSGEPAGSGTEALAANFRAPPGVNRNTEEYNFSATVITAGAFSSLPNLNTARWGAGGAGTKSAGIVFGGRNPPVGLDLALSEEYNGSSWSEGPDLNTATRVCGRGTGTSTAALKHGGHSGSPSTSNKTAEEWNGSSWSNGGASTNNHDGTMQIGTQTAAASCGSGPPTGAKTEEYNGTSWTASNDMPYSAYQGSASGSQTAGVVFGGGYPAVNNSAEYDGTNWTAGNTLIQTTVGHGGNGGSGTQTLAIGAGGYTPGPTYLTAAFTYDGTTFATAPSMATARQDVAAQGANTSFYVAGGLTAPGAASNATEEFTGETTAANVKTLTTS